MTQFTKRYSLLIFAISGTVNMFCCPGQVAVAGNNAKVQDKRNVRVTTGIEQVQGWEQGLIKANPNLARWHWDPIYSYKQGYATITPEKLKPSTGQTGRGSMAGPGRPVYNYNVPPQQDGRPKHIPFSSKALEEVSAKYKQPVKSDLPIAQPQNEQNVFGQVSNKQTQATIVSPKVATYGQPYMRQEKTALQYNSEKANVYGQLLNAKQKTRAAVLKQSSKK